MKLLSVLRAMLREIFEESAYERFCVREGLPRGRHSYSRFVRQTSASGAKVKCC
jgi:hypothetical protein